MPTEPTELRLTIGSRFEDLDLVDSVVDAILRYVRIAEDDLEHTSLAVREAAANAIEHGNGVGSEKRVTVSMKLHAERLTVRVRDEGAGFDPALVADPLAPENLLKPRGRGIFLSRRFVDEVDYDFSDGTVMILRKNLSAAAAPDPSEE
jgi:serine/threonine-protein kinase RsbW